MSNRFRAPCYDRFLFFFFHSFQLLQKEKPGDHLRFISERQISLPRTYIFFKVTNEQKKSKQELEQGNYPQPYPQRVPFVCCLQIFVRKFVYACYVGETTRHFSTRAREHLSTDRAFHVFKHLKDSKQCHSLCSANCINIIDHASTNFQLKIKKALHIKWKKPSLNQQLYHVNLKLLILTRILSFFLLIIFSLAFLVTCFKFNFVRNQNRCRCS